MRKLCNLAQSKRLRNQLQAILDDEKDLKGNNVNGSEESEVIVV